MITTRTRRAGRTALTLLLLAGAALAPTAASQAQVLPRDGMLEVFLKLRNPSNLLRSTSKDHIKLSGTDSDGAKATSVSALFSVRGERGRYDELPLLVHVEPSSEVRLRFIFDHAISGPITISDGKVSQTFTAG